MLHLNVDERFYSRNKRKRQHDVGNEDKGEEPLPYEIELEENVSSFFDLLCTMNFLPSIEFGISSIFPS